MFEELVSVNVMLLVLLFVFVTIFAVNIIASITTIFLSIMIRLRKLNNLPDVQAIDNSKEL